MCFLAIQNFADQSRQLGIDHRLAAADGNDGRAALVDGIQALFHRQLVADRVLVLPDSSAARAGQVAGVQRLQHHDQRKLFNSMKTLSSNVCTQTCRHAERKSHLIPPVSFLSVSISVLGWNSGGVKANGLRLSLFVSQILVLRQRIQGKACPGISGSEDRIPAEIRFP